MHQAGHLQGIYKHARSEKYKNMEFCSEFMALPDAGILSFRLLCLGSIPGYRLCKTMLSANLMSYTVKIFWDINSMHLLCDICCVLQHKCTIIRYWLTWITVRTSFRHTPPLLVEYPTFSTSQAYSTVARGTPHGTFETLAALLVSEVPIRTNVRTCSWQSVSTWPARYALRLTGAITRLTWRVTRWTTASILFP